MKHSFVRTNAPPTLDEISIHALRSEVLPERAPAERAESERVS